MLSPPSISERDLLFLWVRNNRGRCSQIAREFQVSPSFVRSVLYGFSGSTENRIERALIDYGAPCIAERMEK
jgi:hypothetical protein